jgi:hypothetical protein
MNTDCSYSSVERRIVSVRLMNLEESEYSMGIQTIIHKRPISPETGMGRLGHDRVLICHMCFNSKSEGELKVEEFIFKVGWHL